MQIRKKGGMLKPERGKGKIRDGSVEEKSVYWKIRDDKRLFIGRVEAGRRPREVGSATRVYRSAEGRELGLVPPYTPSEPCQGRVPGMQAIAGSK
eukprot:1018562-Rhodomonas_salina.1